MKTLPLTPPPRLEMEFLLGSRLSRVATQLRAIAFHRIGAIIWSSVAIIAAALVFAQRHAPVLAPYAAPSLLGIFILATAISIWFVSRDRTDVTTAAHSLARRHPEVRSVLLAAVEQRPEPSGAFHFLQRRVINDALRHSDTHNWARQPRRTARLLLLAHAVALLAALGLSVLVIRAHRPASEQARGAAGAAVTTLEVTPGDAEFERGSTVVIVARFPAESLPPEAVLVWQREGAAVERAGMNRSLSDPVFAFTLSSVATRVAYHVEYDGKRTRSFTLSVFDRPALVRADAALDYPEYTGLVDRRITDTRRVSAVIGTKLVYDFFVNKPLARASLKTIGENETELPLEAASSERTQFRFSTTMERSARYTLQLEDASGRRNGSPIDIRIEAIENRRPELKLTFPRGDQRVSPLEEMQLQGEARDDFGLHDYGLGVSVADGPPNYLSLKPADSAPVVQANLDHTLRLETQGVKPDQLVTWFAWADDIGPDGQRRRTTSDVFFAEVRRLEEIFREDANGGGANQPGGANGGPGAELIETQRQISIAIWKQRMKDAAAPEFSADTGTIRDSQRAAQEQLATVRERLEEARARAAADEAAPLMKRTAATLDDAAKGKDSTQLDAAWNSARAAYQALLRMQPRDANVSQSRGGGQGGSSRKRDQLNELEFRNENDRYETETQAQPPPTPQQREQLGVLARLRELARRQQDLNARLQELQTALAAAEDEAKREEIRRELKRLEDEQRQMLTDVDEARQRVNRLQPGEQRQRAQQQLERTRDDMQRASEQLAGGEVSQALAAGSRASENLQRTSEDLRKEAAGRFGEQMREARRQARELAANQQDANRQLDEMSRGQQSLDDSEKRDGLAKKFKEQAEKRDGLLENLRQVTEESEGTEPRLHRQLYDLLRQQKQSSAGNDLAASGELLRRGLIDPAREQQQSVVREFDNLQRAVDRAANSVLGDETSELRFAQKELEDLGRELQRDRPGNPGDGKSSPGEASDSAEPGPPGSRDAREAVAQNSQPGKPPDSTPTESKPGQTTDGQVPSSAADASPGGHGGAEGQGQPSDSAAMEELAREFGGAGGTPDATRGPLTGSGFGQWADRLRTVEDLMEAPELRQQLAGARARAEEFRRENQHAGKAPQWDLVEMGIVAPLQDARAWLRQELSRRDKPDALHPIDRDPVPERYAESVRKYYEALGAE